jgi:thiamine pyrophosphokinase
MSRFAILLGGDFSLTPRVAAQTAGARVIAADGGIRHAASLGIIPELWTGDFDSVSDQLAAEWTHIERQVFPAGKDMTDGEIAVNAAIARGASSLVMVGAFGGPRADHAALHLALALRMGEAGFPTVLSSGAQEGRPLLPGEASFDLEPGTLFSIFGFSDLTGLSVHGARWPLASVAVPFGSSLTISNEVTGELRIGLEAGRALLIAHPYPAGSDL